MYPYGDSKYPNSLEGVIAAELIRKTYCALLLSTLLLALLAIFDRNAVLFYFVYFFGAASLLTLSAVAASICRDSRRGDKPANLVRIDLCCGICSHEFPAVIRTIEPTDVRQIPCPRCGSTYSQFSNL